MLRRKLLPITGATALVLPAIRCARADWFTGNNSETVPMAYTGPVQKLRRCGQLAPVTAEHGRSGTPALDQVADLVLRASARLNRGQIDDPALALLVDDDQAGAVAGEGQLANQFLVAEDEGGIGRDGRQAEHLVGDIARRAGQGVALLLEGVGEDGAGLLVALEVVALADLVQVGVLVDG